MPRDSLENSTTGAANAPRSATLGAVEYGLIALQSTLWGSTFFFISIAREHMPPLTLSMVRLIPAVLLLLAVVAAMGLRLPATVAQWRHLFAFSVLNNVLPFVMIIVAQREVTGGIAGIFMATSPLFALLIAPLVVPEEHFTWRRLAGILVGIAGVAVLTGANGAAGTWRAQGLLLASALCFSLANIYARTFLGGLHPFVIASSQTIGSLTLTLPLALLIEHPWSLPAPSGHVWLAVIVMGMFGSALAPLCHFTVLKRAGPVNAMLASIVVPVTPVLLGAAFLSEHLHPREFVGGLIIALALIIIDGRVFGSLRRRLLG